jgi:putative DNA primase/helicase
LNQRAPDVSSPIRRFSRGGGDLISAKEMAKALGGRRVGNGWSACCPAHDDHQPSLSIRDAEDGKVLVHCHAGRAQGKVIQVLRLRGLWEDRNYESRLDVRDRYGRGAVEREDDDASKRIESALRIWKAAEPADGTVVETYLHSRGLDIPAPSVIRYHAGLKHSSGSTWPAMIALVTRTTDDAAVAVHRTYLSRDGSGKAPISPQKMMLGPCRGGAVRLAPLGSVLLVGEGIENCLACMLATNLPAWAALSTSGLRSLDLPIEAQDVIIVADGDHAGLTAALSAALHWSRPGRRVRIARPPWGADFNDLLLTDKRQSVEVDA